MSTKWANFTTHYFEFGSRFIVEVSMNLFFTKYGINFAFIVLLFSICTVTHLEVRATGAQLFPLQQWNTRNFPNQNPIASNPKRKHLHYRFCWDGKKKVKLIAVQKVIKLCSWKQWMFSQIGLGLVSFPVSVKYFHYDEEFPARSLLGLHLQSTK